MRRRRMTTEMSDDLPPDLERLLTLKVWHAMWLARIDNKIADILVLSVVDDVSCS